MMKKLVLSLSLLIVAACGVDGQESTEAVSSTRQAMCLSCQAWPVVPSVPTDYISYMRLHDGVLIPAGVSSVYTVTWQDPANSAWYLSLGYDVVARKNLFYIRGTLASDYARMNAVVATQATSPIGYLDTGTQGSVHNGPPPLPPGGFGELAWNAVSASYAATH